MNGSEDLDPNSTIKENGESTCGPQVCTDGFTLVGTLCVCTAGNVVINGQCVPATCSNPAYAAANADICNPICGADGTCDPTCSP